jgi:hypothetical protein
VTFIDFTHRFNSGASPTLVEVLASVGNVSEGQSVTSDMGHLAENLWYLTQFDFLIATLGLSDCLRFPFSSFTVFIGSCRDTATRIITDWIIQA